MKLILIIVFVCSLDVLTLLAETTAVVNETEAATSERNGRSSDSFGIQYNFSSRQKRDVERTASQKLQYRFVSRHRFSSNALGKHKKDIKKRVN